MTSRRRPSRPSPPFQENPTASPCLSCRRRSANSRPAPSRLLLAPEESLTTAVRLSSERKSQTKMPEEVFIFPASFAQERLWFLEQMEPGTGIYHLPTIVRLQGMADLCVLADSLEEIIRRHESLRTTFATIDGVPVQV